ncbi:hypothetical protein Tco_1070233 [Tanacetum coccineum]|uniref:Ubinuclein middle domain-containing protein n=1 Tax=Tanacetum coccineum TaxID=301880 RepID=A0ABQ5HKX7_9ASTR
MKLVLHDESEESKGELENRPTGKKERIPIAVVIQESPSIPAKKTQESSGKLKGIDLLYDTTQLELETQREIKASRHEIIFQHQTGGSSEGAGLRPDVPDELTRKSADSDEGAGTLPEVSDVSEDKSKARDDLDDWGSTNDEEYLLAYKDEKPKDILWQSTDDEEFENDDEEDESDEDKSIDIKKTDDERTNTDDEDTPLDAFQKVLRSHTKECKKEHSKKKDYKDIIEESIQANVINEVKNFLLKFLPHAVKEALEKTPPSLGQSSFQGQSTIKAAESLFEYELKKILYAKMHKSQSNLTHEMHQELFDVITWPMLLDETNMEKGDKPNTVLKKRDRGDDQDKDPSIRSNQGKKTKKRRGNESKSSKKTSTTKESSKGKSPARTSKSGKSVGDAGQPPHTDADETQADTASKIPKNDWFKKSPRPETLDQDWNTVKIVDDAPE